MRRQEIYISAACLPHFCVEVTRSETTFPSLSLSLRAHMFFCLSLCSDKSGVSPGRRAIGEINRLRANGI